jgi:GH15 family glucan-1,4-alpha-glucosidase
MRHAMGDVPLAGSPFAPIAEYAFLSDCEVAALVAPSGNVEWLCLPRFDGPSVFGSMLDRDAGMFRLAPVDATVPAGRRYLPGTMVLETTWGTATGWIVVRDVLLIGPWHHVSERSPAHPRSPTDSEAATGALVAAPTTSLPESPGVLRPGLPLLVGARPTFALWGLYMLGFDEDANDFFYFIRDVLSEDPRLQVLYGIGGERELPERTLDHRSGYDAMGGQIDDHG